MANLPATTTKKSSLHKPEVQERIIDLLEEGYTVSAAAQELTKKRPELAKVMRMRIRHLMRTDEAFQASLAGRGHENLVAGLPAATNMLVRKAARGRNVAERKLLFEATGFHNPRVKHEHTGDIKITIDMPRPTFVDGSITDATVVEDGSGGRE